MGGRIITGAVGVILMLTMSVTSLPHMDFEHWAVLDQKGHYHMHWTPREKDIIIEVQVATKGYVGLGFSPNGGMKGADIVLGWVDNEGQVHAHDRYAFGMMIPMIDDSQDVEVLGGYQNDTHTVLRFSRPWNTCDKEHDFQLSGDTMRVIWAYSDEDPVNEYVMRKHEHRGTKSIYLQEPRFSLPTFGDDVSTWDVRLNNVSVPGNVDTLYWCQLFKAPPLNRKTHVIGYVPIIEERNFENVHHMLLYECHLPDSERHYEKWLDVNGVQCFTPNMPLSWESCRSPIIAWAIGSEGEIFPEHVGFPLREEYGGATYYMIEMHYDNPNFRQGIVDSSGLRIFMTENLREYDAGFLVLGHGVRASHIIPPGQEWKSISHCDADCLIQTLPAEGINVFQGLLHTHLLGTDITVRQIRQGRELPIVFQDMNYDFNYQQTRVLNEEMTILPGDSFITECGYDSRHKKIPTFGGESTEEEMCLAFLMYYPRSSVSSCQSTPDISVIYKSFGIEEVYSHDRNTLWDRNEEINEKHEAEMVATLLNKSGEEQEGVEIEFSKMYRSIVAKSPEDMKNVSMYDLLHDPKTWDNGKIVAKLQEEVAFGKHEAICTDEGNNRIKGFPRSYYYPDFMAIQLLDDECDLQHKPDDESTAYQSVSKGGANVDAEEQDKTSGATQMNLYTPVIIAVCLSLLTRQ